MKFAHFFFLCEAVVFAGTSLLIFCGCCARDFEMANNYVRVSVGNELERDVVAAMASTRRRVVSTPSTWLSESLRVSRESYGSIATSVRAGPM